MIDIKDFNFRGGSALVEFCGLPKGIFTDAIYIENTYHKRFNRFLSKKHKWLDKNLFDKYESGFTHLIYLPHEAKKLKRKRYVLYHAPFLNRKQLQQLSEVGTKDLFEYLEDPDDVRFLKPGFMFYIGTKENGRSVYEYYPLVCVDNKNLSYNEQIEEILKAHAKKIDDYKRADEKKGSAIGQGGVYCTTSPKGEDFADSEFERNIDPGLRLALSLFAKQFWKLRQNGVPLAVLERIIHQEEKLSRMIISKKNEIILPDYNNLEIKMEPLVKAVYFLFLRHPEGILFKHLPDYRQELLSIYGKLRPLGLGKRSIRSIEDVTNPCLNSINEKCARIRAAFILKFDEHLAEKYYVTGGRGEPKKILLSRDLVVWE